MPKPGHAIKRLNVHFNFLSHGGKSDAERIRRTVSAHKPHIYVPELVSDPKVIVRTERAMEEGKVDRQYGEHEFRGFFEEEARIVAEHGLPVKILLPYSDMVRNSYVKLGKLSDRAEAEFIDGQFEKALNTCLEYSKASAGVHAFREKVLVDALKNFRHTLVPKAVKKNPNLRDAEELNVLVTLGASHRTVVDLLKKHHELNVSKSFLMDYPAVVFPFSEEILQMAKRGTKFELANPVHKLLFARAVVSGIITKTFLNELVSENFVKTSAGVRLLCKKLSLEDCEFLCKNWSSGARNALEKVLAPKGLKIPESLEDLDGIIAHSSLSAHFGLKRKFRTKN